MSRYPSVWPGRLILLLLALVVAASCEVERRMPEAVTVVDDLPPAEKLQVERVLSVRDCTVTRPVRGWVRLGHGYALKKGSTQDFYLVYQTTGGLILLPWEPRHVYAGDSVSFPADRYVR